MTLSPEAVAGPLGDVGVEEVVRSQRGGVVVVAARGRRHADQEHGRWRRRRAEGGRLCEGEGVNTGRAGLHGH